MSSFNDVRICQSWLRRWTRNGLQDPIRLLKRSYPNRLPLSGTVVARIAKSVSRFSFDRLYGNFDTVIESDAARIVQESAERHIAWINGEFDELT